MAAVELPRRKFTAEDLLKMDKAGLFDEDDRIELLDGDIVHMSPIGRDHAWSVNRLNMFFARKVGDYATVQVQGPVRLADYWVPQPDLAMLRNETYLNANPRRWANPDDLLLVIEVAESSLRYDRAKLPAYARAGLQEVWVVDIPHEVVFVHQDPADDEYRMIRTYRRGESMTPLRLPDLTITVDEILS
jgi:Uma2 family endonuclease